MLEEDVRKMKLNKPSKQSARQNCSQWMKRAKRERGRERQAQTFQQTAIPKVELDMISFVCQDRWKGVPYR